MAQQTALLLTTKRNAPSRKKIRDHRENEPICAWHSGQRSHIGSWNPGQTMTGINCYLSRDECTKRKEKEKEKAHNLTATLAPQTR